MWSKFMVNKLESGYISNIYSITFISYRESWPKIYSEYNCHLREYT